MDPPHRILEQVDDLMIVRVNQAGPLGRWHKDHLADLAMLASDVGAITDILQGAILAASDQIDLMTGQALAEILHLPWNPKQG